MFTIERVFMDIDTQFDFMDPKGKLYVPGAVEIWGTLDRLFAFAWRHGIPVLSSVDEHPPNDPEFERFGPHCIRGTPGQRKLPTTLLDRSLTIRPDDSLPDGPAKLMAGYDQLIFCKPTLNVFDNPHFPALIDALDVSEYVVFGVATDYCVLLEASELLKRGRRVKIVSDAVRGLAAETERQARETLTTLGAEWVDTAAATVEFPWRFV